MAGSDYENMIEQQERNSFAQAQDPSSPWYGWDPEVVDYYRSNSPAGFGSWGSNMAPGTVLSQAQVSEVINNLNQPGHFDGVNGMTLDQYLADPRAHFYQNDDGQFIYSPKRDKAALPGGDFVSTDRESLLESLGGIPMLAGFLAGPIAQIAGIGSLGAAGASAGNAGAEFFGAQNFLGDVASTAASGAAPAAAATNPVSFVQDIPLNPVSSAFQVPVTPGPIDPGFTSLADLAGPVTPVSTNLAAGGMNSIDQLINSITSGGAQTVGSVGAGVVGAGLDVGSQIAQGLSTAPVDPGLTQPPAPVQNITTPGTQPGTTNVPAGTMTTAATGASTASALSRLLDGTATTDDWLKLGSTLGSGLLGAYSANQQGDAIRDESARLDAIQSPWRGKLSEMYANPGNFLNSAPVRASIDQGTQATARALSTQYGNPALAPNAVAEISKYANNSLYDKWGAEANRLAAFGGLNFPATASSSLNVQGADADNGVYDALGYTLGQLTAPQQMTVADLLRQMNSGNVFGGQTVRV